VSSTDHKAPHCAVFSTPLLPHTLDPNISPQHPILEHPQPLFLRYCQTPTFAPYKTTGKIIVLCILKEYI